MNERDWVAKQLFEITKATCDFRGPKFFVALTLCLTHYLNLRFAFITEHRDSATLGYTIAFAEANNHRPNFSYDLSNLPCRTVLAGQSVNVPCNLAELFPGASEMVSYCGHPLLDDTGQVMGLIAIEDDKPLQNAEGLAQLLKFLAPRIALELEKDRRARGIPVFAQQTKSP